MAPGLPRPSPRIADTSPTGRTRVTRARPRRTGRHRAERNVSPALERVNASAYASCTCPARPRLAHMVTSTHEASHRLFQDHPEALAPAFEALGLPPPSKKDFGALSPDATEVRPLERRVDTVLAYEPPMGEHFLV